VSRKTSSARRRVLTWLGGALLAPNAFAQLGRQSSRVSHESSPIARFAEVIPGYTLRFPEDEGTHPTFRVEWWYVTGLLQTKAPTPVGFQVTFFRVKSARETENPSAFAPRQILIAHAAISDPRHGRLRYQQRAARTGFELAEAMAGRTAVWIDDWALDERAPVYRIRVPTREFGFDFVLTAVQPPLLNGEQGYSRKGPARLSASYYYSVPQLSVRGTLIHDKKAEPVTGKAWLDHEWSSSYLDEHAAGWDWIGINFDDGGALMAFRIRDRQQGRFWAGGTYRDAKGMMRTFAPEAIMFTALRHWQSPRTGTRYPIAWKVSTGEIVVTIEPYMDDQEQDARSTTDALYWEGAVQAFTDGVRTGAGYLELTGYGKPLRL
jgi:predicted secreted hydrolase